MWNKHKRKEATTQTKEGICNQVLLKHEEKLVQTAMSAFLFLYGRLWMAQLVPGSPVCKVPCKQIRKHLPQELPP